MGLLDGLLQDLGITSSRKKKAANNPPLPNLGEIKEKLEEVVGGISDLKNVPKDLIGKLVEADEDFRGADKALRSTRLQGKKR